VTFSVVRYGNVVGSRGSVVPLFQEQKKQGVITITDKRMTRFWITLEHGVRFVLKCLEIKQGGEIFVPKIPSMNIMDLAKTIAPECKIKITGIRPGEKIHEVLVPRDEARQVKEYKDMFVIEPNFPWWGRSGSVSGKKVNPDFEYTSDKNEHWLTIHDLKKMIEGSF